MGSLKNYSAFWTLALMLILTKGVDAQSFIPLDQSPHDIVYCRSSDPLAYPIVKVVYGRPSARNNTVFGTQVPFGKIWRTGSNESTEIKFYQDVMFGNKFVQAGTYVLYTIPNENYWTIILSKQTDTYGSFLYKPENNIAKIKVPAGNGKMIENFTIVFTPQDYGSLMVLAWAKTRIKVPLYTDSRLLTKR